MLEDVRLITKENKFLENVVNIMLQSTDLDAIKEAA
jgi:hypothetical protein